MHYLSNHPPSERLNERRKASPRSQSSDTASAGDASSTPRHALRLGIRPTPHPKSKKRGRERHDKHTAMCMSALSHARAGMQCIGGIACRRRLRRCSQVGGPQPLHSHVSLSWVTRLTKGWEADIKVAMDSGSRHQLCPHFRRKVVRCLINLCDIPQIVGLEGIRIPDAVHLPFLTTTSLPTRPWPLAPARRQYRSCSSSSR